MIFFDSTGKRWRKVKLSAAGMALLAAAPVALLGAGTLIYQPKWGQLPVISQAHNFVDQAANFASGQVAAATHPSVSPSPSAKPKASSKPVATTVTVTTAAGASTPAPTPAVLSAQTHTTPHATATATPSPTPQAAPGNSGSHSKGTPSPKH